MKTKELVINGKKITIWKMNFGFVSDYQSDTINTNIDSKTNSKNTVIDNGKVILMTLVYGIYESDDLGISKPGDLGLGFTDAEKKDRLRKIRTLDFNTDVLFEEINKINTEVEEEVLKK